MMPRLPENLRHIMMTPMCILMLLIVPSLHAGGKFYQQRNLVSDGSVTAEHTDANLGCVDEFRVQLYVTLRHLMMEGTAHVSTPTPDGQSLGTHCRDPGVGQAPRG